MSDFWCYDKKNSLIKADNFIENYKTKILKVCETFHTCYLQGFPFQNFGGGTRFPPPTWASCWGGGIFTPIFGGGGG